MDNALYVGLSRQMTLRRELDLVANNIANADTAGFKVESVMLRANPQRDATTAGGPRPISFVQDDGVARNFGQGALRSTGGDFDLAIEGDAFFRIAAPEGERYTRDGRFKLDEAGRLTTQDGHPVGDEGGGEIVIDPALGPVRIAPDGTISQGEALVGNVGMVRFDEKGVLEKAGDNLFRNTSNLQPQAAPDARLRQGFLEAANVEPVLEITRLIEVTRAYESVTRMMESTADLSRRSVERLGRVN